MLLLMMELHWSAWGNLLRGKSSGIKFTGIKLMRCRLGGLPKFGSNFYYDFDMWQYSETGKINGIEGDVDMNLFFLR